MTNSKADRLAAADAFEDSNARVDVLASLKENGLGMRWDSEKRFWIIIENGKETVMGKDAGFSVFEYLHATDREAVITGDEDGERGNW